MKIIIALIIALSASSTNADQYVRGHVRRDGTYVEPHYRSNRDNNPYNNYSTQGNVNPYTGEEGTRDPLELSEPRLAHPITPPAGFNPYNYDR